MAPFHARLPKILRAITSALEAWPSTPLDELNTDIDAILDGFRLQTIRRYFRQVYWLEESNIAAEADTIEPGLKLENVAAHTWHVADTVLLLADRFAQVNSDRALRLALLHDKLEIYTGDFDPVGAGGEGADTHAFNAEARARKVKLERAALNKYLETLPYSARNVQRPLIEENLQASTREARFVKAIDKLQALAFVHEKKWGRISDAHLLFSLRYSLLSMEFFRNRPVEAGLRARG
jgi:5'-deoxynucleotidase YfbR-like HD superfamily hydrolase